MPPFYIGSTSVYNIEKKRYRGSVSSKEYKKLWKDKPDNMFKVVIVSLHETRNEAQNKESEIQRKLDILTKPTIYVNRNIAGREFAPQHGPRSETGPAISRAKRGQKYRKHKFRSLEHRQKISINRSGKSLPEDVKLRISKKLKGHKISEQTREKMSLVRKGRKFSDVQRAAMSKAQKGKKLTEDHKANLKLAAKTRKRISNEDRLRMSEAQRNRRKREKEDNIPLTVSG